MKEKGKTHPSLLHGPIASFSCFSLWNPLLPRLSSLHFVTFPDLKLSPLKVLPNCNPFCILGFSFLLFIWGIGVGVGVGGQAPWLDDCKDLGTWRPLGRPRQDPWRELYMVWSWSHMTIAMALAVLGLIPWTHCRSWEKVSGFSVTIHRASCSSPRSSSAPSPPFSYPMS